MKVLPFNRYVESLTPWRGRALSAAIIWLAYVFIAGGRVELAKMMLDWGLVSAVLVQVVGSGFDALLIVELFRVLLPSAAGWDEHKHFLIVGSIWGVFMLISLGVLAVVTNQQG